MFKKVLFCFALLSFLGFGCGRDQQYIIEEQQRKIDDLSIKLDQAEAEDPVVKVERCKAEAGNLSKAGMDFIKQDDEDELSSKAFLNALDSCYRSSWTPSMQKACGESTSKRFNKLREEEQTRLYNKYYSECLSK